MTFAEHYPEVRDLVDGLWAHPELGYAEHRTSGVVADFLSRHAPDLPLTRFSTTGIRVDLPSAGPGRHRVAVVAELDAARDAGMQTMYEDGIAKALAGETTIEEVLRVTEEG